MADIVADAAFYYGLVNFLVGQTRPVWSRLSFADATSNFFTGARDGIHAQMTWPTLGTIPASELVTEHLLEQAEQGLKQLAVDPALIQKHLGIIEGRARKRQNGATWQLAALDNATAADSTTYTSAEGHDVPDSTPRRQAIARMLSAYIDNQKSGKPVHTWSTNIG